MRWCPALVLCLVASWPVAGQAPVSSAPDEAAIREVVRNYVDARDKRDPARLAALFTEDADQLTTAGDWRKGRDNVVQGGLASSQANPGAREIAIETIRFVAPGVAIADGRYDIAAVGAAPARRMRTTFVLTKPGAGGAAARTARRWCRDPDRDRPPESTGESCLG